jgi:heterodisulfide reductase subunit E
MLEYYKPWLFFWLTAIAAHGYMDYSFYRKWRDWSQGTKQPLHYKGKQWRVAKIWLSEVFLQRQLFGLSPFRWFAHITIFWGFIGLALLSIATFILKPLDFLGIGWAHYFFYGKGYILTKIWGDGFGLALMLGLALAGIRRFIMRPAQQINNQMDIFLLVFLFWLTLSGFLLEGLRLSRMPHEMARYSFIGQFFIPGGLTVDQLKMLLPVAWGVHALSALALLVYLPHSKLMHSILAPLVIALNAVEESEREDLYWPDIKKHRANTLHKT